jgi:hypothetical protein
MPHIEIMKFCQNYWSLLDIEESCTPSLGLVRRHGIPGVSELRKVLGTDELHQGLGEGGQILAYVQQGQHRGETDPCLRYLETEVDICFTQMIYREMGG